MRGICRRFGPQRAGLRTDRWPTAPHATAPWPPSSLLIRCRSAVFPRNTSRRPPSAPPGFASTNASRACLHASNAFHTSVSGHSDATNRNNRSSTPEPIGARRRITTPPRYCTRCCRRNSVVDRPAHRVVEHLDLDDDVVTTSNWISRWRRGVRRGDDRGHRRRPGARSPRARHSSRDPLSTRLAFCAGLEVSGSRGSYGFEGLEDRCTQPAWTAARSRRSRRPGRRRPAVARTAPVLISADETRHAARPHSVVTTPLGARSVRSCSSATTGPVATAA